MKNQLTIIVFLFSASLLRAQDTTLPKGISTIYLHSGKTIKNVVLWRIDSAKVEYVLSGNLADLKTMDVSKIETPDFLIEFDQEYQPMKKGYDIIVLNTKDTLRGLIQRVDDGEILFRPVSSDKIKRIMKSEVENYVQWRDGAGSIAYSDADQNTTPAFHSGSDSDTLALEELIPVEGDENETTEYVGEEIINKEKDNTYYVKSYERGVIDAMDSKKSMGWGGGGFLLGMTVGSPFLSLSAANSKVELENVPSGVNDKLYRAGFENEIVKKRSKKAAAGAIAGKILLLIIVIASF